MQNRQSGGRRRRGGGGNNNPRPMGMASGGQNANRLEVKVRGNAHQLLEKYKQLARDAHQSGDRVASEYYLQHADHYFRVLNDSRLRQEEMRARRGVFDQFDDDQGGDEDVAAEGGEEQARSDDGGQERGQDRGGERQRQFREGGERRQRFEQRERGDGERQGGEMGGERERPRRWQERRSEQAERSDVAESEAPRVSGETLELRLSDGEAALVAFGGVPEREPIADEASEAPKPRRRGRPRKSATESVEG